MLNNLLKMQMYSTKKTNWNNIEQCRYPHECEGLVPFDSTLKRILQYDLVFEVSIVTQAAWQ